MEKVLRQTRDFIKLVISEYISPDVIDIVLLDYIDWEDLEGYVVNGL